MCVCEILKESIIFYKSFSKLYLAFCFWLPFGLPTGLTQAFSLKGVVFEADFCIFDDKDRIVSRWVCDRDGVR